MVTIEFESQNIFIQANASDPFKEIINKFSQKISVSPNELEFLANARIIDPEKKVDNYLNKLNKVDGNIKILASKIDKEDKKDVIEKCKYIICPECKEPCKIKFDDYKVKLYECCNGHVNDGIKIDDFPKTQEINISLILCDQCQIRNKGNAFNNEFYRCLNCKKNICILCKSNHDINHNIIKYEQKNYICPKHYELYIKYCKQCNNNICYSCKTEHKNHGTISLSDNEPDIEKQRKD